MKISNWESIPYSVGLQCPNGDDGSLMEGKSKVIGWCDTPKGLMKVCECQVCFSKFRYHGFHGSLEAFLNSLEEDCGYNNWQAQERTLPERVFKQRIFYH